MMKVVVVKKECTVSAVGTAENIPEVGKVNVVCAAADFVLALIAAGRGTLYSSFNKNSFSHLLIELMDGVSTYINRYDNTDPCFEYEGDCHHNMMRSFRNYKRTISTGSEGAVLTVKFEGTGFALFGETEGDAVIMVETEGEIPQKYQIRKTGSREISCCLFGLENRAHTAKITVLKGTYSVGGMEVIL